MQSHLSILALITWTIGVLFKSCWLCPYLQGFFLCFLWYIQSFQASINSLRHFFYHSVDFTKDSGITRKHTISYKTTWITVLGCYVTLVYFKIKETPFSHLFQLLYQTSFFLHTSGRQHHFSMQHFPHCVLFLNDLRCVFFLCCGAGIWTQSLVFPSRVHLLLLPHRHKTMD
jgi:hypothetical protein